MHPGKDVGGCGRPSGAGGRCCAAAVVALALCLATGAGAAFAGDVTVTKAWVAPTDQIGADAVLSLKLANGGEDDALLRVSCPFANFSEKRTIDHGEGAPSKRVIPNIAVPAHGEVTLVETGDHVALLQVREPLVEGASYTCNLSFRKAGPIAVPVKISRSEPSS
jgi:periplasmic copper chaperone A